MSAASLIPPGASLTQVRELARGCTACDLYRNATQTVFGEGRAHAKLLMVGEQPGNDEDLKGHPFVGPAGRLLDEGLEAAGIDRTQAYVTNVVKHFKWIGRGKRRIHAKPNAVEISACIPWLETEIRLVKPELVVALGATAAQALLGRQFRVTQQRGRVIESPTFGKVIATIHPSAILRSPDEPTRRAEMELFIDDLRAVAQLIA